MISIFPLFKFATDISWRVFVEANPEIYETVAKSVPKIPGKKLEARNEFPSIGNKL